MKQYLISEEFRNGLLNYLGERPWKESAQAIALLSQLPEAPKAEVVPLANNDAA